LHRTRTHFYRGLVGTALPTFVELPAINIQ
jgi:hypothetical protein